MFYSTDLSLLCVIALEKWILNTTCNAFVNIYSQALAVAWTGILSTAINFCIEITGLGRVPSSEASVILATEPLWASLFAALLFHEQFGTSDYVGGALMISACLVNTLRPSDFDRLLSTSSEPTTE